jgi:hypothetical protein
MTRSVVFNLTDGTRVQWTPPSFRDRDVLMDSIGRRENRFIVVSDLPVGPKARMLNIDHIVSVDL